MMKTLKSKSEMKAVWPGKVRCGRKTVSVYRRPGGNGFMVASGLRARPSRFNSIAAAINATRPFRGAHHSALFAWPEGEGTHFLVVGPDALANGSLYFNGTPLTKRR